MKILMEVEFPDRSSGDPLDWDHSRALRLSNDMVAYWNAMSHHTEGAFVVSAEITG